MGLLDKLSKLSNFVKLAVRDPEAAKEKLERKIDKKMEDISTFAKEVEEYADAKMDTFKYEVKKGAETAAEYMDEKVGVFKHYEDDTFAENVAKTAGNGVIGAVGIALGGGLTSCSRMNDTDKSVADAYEKYEQEKTEGEKAQYRLDILKNDTANKYIHETPDGIKFNYNVDGQNKPFIDLDGVIIKIDHQAITEDMPGKAVVDYINKLGEELSCEGVTYRYIINETETEPVTVFDNGFQHRIDESVEVTPDSTLGTALKMFEDLGLYEPTSNIPLAIENTEGSYDGQKGFSLELVEPKDLHDLVTGNPTVKGSIRDYDFEGEMSKDANGNILIKNKNGDELIIKNVQGFNVGTDEYPTIKDGTVISIKKNGETEFTDTYFMYKFDDGKTNIGTLDKEYGTTFQNYGHDNKEMSLKAIVESDQHYHEKEKILIDVQKKAHDDYYSIEVPPDVYEAKAHAEITIENE